MEIAAVTNTEPAPEQFTARRGKARSWERGIVYDPEHESVRIRKIKKIERDANTSYMSCALPSSPIVNVFLSSKNAEDRTVITSGAEGVGKEQEGIVFLGRLNLEKLGMRDQFSRFCGQLKTLYIVTSSPSRPEKGTAGEQSV